MLTFKLKIPAPRGRGKKCWAKRITGIRPNSQTGYDWGGDWLTPGTEAELFPGDIVAVGDADGVGAAVYVAVPDGSFDPAVPWFYELQHNGTTGWAAAMCSFVRSWLDMHISDRVKSVKSMRADALASILSTATGDTVKINGHDRPTCEVRKRIALLRGQLPAATVEPVKPPHMSDHYIWSEFQRRGLSLDTQPGKVK